MTLFLSSKARHSGALLDAKVGGSSEIIWYKKLEATIGNTEKPFVKKKRCPKTHGCVFVCVWRCECVKDLCHVEAKGQLQVLFLRSHPYCFLRQGVFMGLELTSPARMASEPRNPAVPASQIQACATTPGLYLRVYVAVWFDEFDPYP